MLPLSGGCMGMLPCMLPFMLPSRRTNVTIVWGSYGYVTIHVTMHVTIEKNNVTIAWALYEDVTIHVTIHVTIEKTSVTIVWGGRMGMLPFMSPFMFCNRGQPMLPSSGGCMRMLPFMLTFMLPSRIANVTIVWWSYEDVTYHSCYHSCYHSRYHRENQCYHCLGVV